MSPQRGLLVVAHVDHSELCFSVSIQPQYSMLITKGRYLRTDAWHVVTSTDPLVDSDEELDEYVRNDYSEYFELVPQTQPLMVIVDQRIAVIARLRGRAPTPPPDIVVPPNNVSDTREHRWRTVQSWR
jgi:Ino eighty subunit 1